MPFVGGNDDDFHLARKRRWDDDDNNIYYCDQLHAGGGGGGGYGSLFDQGQCQQQHQQQHQHPGFYHLDLDLPRPSCKTILPLPSKRARVAVAGADTTSTSTINNNNSSSNNNSSLFHDTRSPRRRVSQQRLSEQLATSKRPTTATLTPCHICHRRPTRKSDLDSFADCQGCGQRACFICIRQCQGRANDDEQLSDDVGADVDEGVRMLSRSITMDECEAQPEGEEEDEKEDQNGDAPGPWRRLQHRHRHHHKHHKHHRHHSRRDDDNDDATSRDLRGWAASGHRSVVCSRCCVEKGHQGEVVCLGCLCEMPGA